MDKRGIEPDKQDLTLKRMFNGALAHGGNSFEKYTHPSRNIGKYFGY